MTRAQSLLVLSALLISVASLLLAFATRSPPPRVEDLVCDMVITHHVPLNEREVCR